VEQRAIEKQAMEKQRASSCAVLIQTDETYDVHDDPYHDQDFEVVEAPPLVVDNNHPTQISEYILQLQEKAQAFLSDKANNKSASEKVLTQAASMKKINKNKEKDKV